MNETITTPDVLNCLTRKDLVAAAKSMGLPVGKSKQDTIANIAVHVAAGKATLKSTITLTVFDEVKDKPAVPRVVTLKSFKA